MNRMMSIAALAIFIVLSAGCASSYNVQHALETDNIDKLKLIYEKHPDLLKDCLDHGYNEIKHEKMLLCPVDWSLIGKGHDGFGNRNYACRGELLEELLDMGLNPSTEDHYSEYIRRALICPRVSIVLSEHAPPAQVAKAATSVIVKDTWGRIENDIAAIHEYEKEREIKKTNILIKVDVEDEFDLSPHQADVMNAILQRNDLFCKQGHQDNCEAKQTLENKLAVIDDLKVELARRKELYRKRKEEEDRYFNTEAGKLEWICQLIEQRARLERSSNIIYVDGHPYRVIFNNDIPYDILREHGVTISDTEKMLDEMVDFYRKQFGKEPNLSKCKLEEEGIWKIRVEPVE